MVNINRIIFASAIAAIVNAVPIAEARPIAVANAQPIINDAPRPHGDGYANKNIILVRDTFKGNMINKRESPVNYNVTKRADAAVTPDLSTLLSQSTSLFREGLKAIWNFEGSFNDNQIVTLLTEINSHLKQVETSIENYVLAAGNGNEIQNLAVENHIHSFVINLSSFVGALVTHLSQDKNQQQSIALAQELQNRIEGISKASSILSHSIKLFIFSLKDLLSDISESISLIS